MQIKKINSAVELKNCVENKIPAIYEGYALDWNAHKTWDIEFFKKHFGDIKVGRMKSSSNIHPDFTHTTDWEIYESTLGEYLQDILLSGATNEISQYFLAGDTLQILCDSEYNPLLQSLSNDFPLPELYTAGELKNIGLWISSKGPISWLHFDKDHSDNFNVQVNGSKYACLYDPKDAPNLYLKGILESPYYNFSNVDVRNTDFSNTPKVESAMKYEGILNPGDMLYIPSDWFHSFKHLGEFNINLTFWWVSDHQVYNKLRSRENYIISLMKYFQLDFSDLSIKDNEIKIHDPAVRDRLMLHLKNNPDFEMFKQLENNMINN